MTTAKMTAKKLLPRTYQEGLDTGLKHGFEMGIALRTLNHQAIIKSRCRTSKERVDMERVESAMEELEKLRKIYGDRQPFKTFYEDARHHYLEIKGQ